MEYSINTDFLYDKGNGFEKGRVLQGTACLIGDDFHINLDMKVGFEPQILCWCPFNVPVFIKSMEIKGAEIVGHNAHRVDDNNYTFILGDVFFYLRPFKGVQQITIICTVQNLSVGDQRELLRDDAATCKDLRIEIEQLNGKVKQLTADLESVTNSTIWRKTEPLRRWKDKKTVDGQSVGQQEGIVRQYDENTSIEDLLYSSIDIVKIKDRILTIEGWIICVEHEISEAKLLLEDSYGMKHSCDIELKGRRDVADTLGVRFTGDCGIIFCADYESYSEQKILLELLIDGSRYVVDTHKYIPACKNAEGGMFAMEPYCEGEPPLDYWRFYQKNVCQEFADDICTNDWKADIVVPVYNGLEYLPKLFEGIEKTKVAYRLIIVDDCSPDESVYPYLEKYASAHSNVVLMRNESNRGFVKTVNRALKESGSHVVLVNTDVELPDMWLERILHPMYQQDKVASVTPFSNSATIYSFPNFGEDNSLFLGLSVEEIDCVFSKLVPRNISTPTGVGFCMAMNREAIDQIGFLDDETFEKGYGEENDWCQRAIKAGYQNVYAENLFVYHNHGGSFASETKQRLLKENGAKLLKKHPDYQLDVESFCRQDPNRDIRIYAKFELMFSSEIPMVLAFDHDLGGGAAAYLDSKLQEQLQQGKMVGVVRYNDIADRYRLKVSYGEYNVQIVARNRKEIMELLKRRRYEQVWINELASYLELEGWLKDIASLRKNHAGVLRMLVHDYFSVCPSLNLVTPECKYCGIPDNPQLCEECLATNEYIYNHEYTSILKWREDWEKLLMICDEIIVFSKDSEKRIKEVYPHLEGIQLIPHQVEPLPVVQKCEHTSTVTVGILGAISGQKGLGLIKKMISYLEKHEMDMRIVIIGEAAEKLESPVLTVTGRYHREEIPLLTKEHDIDVFLIPSVWPETFSYTTAEIMSMEMPLVVFDIGAPAERVKEYEKGLVLENLDPETDELLRMLYEFTKRREYICKQ